MRLALPLLTVSWIKNRLGLTSHHLFTNRLSRHWECRRVTCFEIVFILFCHFILKPVLVHIHQMNTMGVKCGITVVDSALMPLCPAEIFGLHGQKEKKKFLYVRQSVCILFSLFISVVIFMNKKRLIESILLDFYIHFYSSLFHRKGMLSFSGTIFRYCRWECSFEESTHWEYFKHFHQYLFLLDMCIWKKFWCLS